MVRWRTPGVVPSPTPMIPISFDLITVIARSGCLIFSVSAAMKPAVPPPRITTLWILNGLPSPELERWRFARRGHWGLALARPQPPEPNPPPAAKAPRAVLGWLGSSDSEPPGVPADATPS